MGSPISCISARSRDLEDLKELGLCHSDPLAFFIMSDLVVLRACSSRLHFHFSLAAEFAAFSLFSGTFIRFDCYCYLPFPQCLYY